MKRFLALAALATFLMVGCGDDKTTKTTDDGEKTNKTSAGDKTNKTIAEINARKTDSESNGNTSKPDDNGKGSQPDIKDLDAEVMALRDSGWKFLESRYNNVEQNPYDAWGPKASDVISAFVLYGALASGSTNLEDPKVVESVQSILDHQTSTGTWTLTRGKKGERAVYSTSAVIKLLSWIRDNGGEAWSKRVHSANEKAMAYIRSAQIGAPDSPLNELGEDNMHFGGWAYSKEELALEKNKEKPPANLSTTIFALDAAQAFGLDKKDPLFARAQKFLQMHQNTGEADKRGIKVMIKVGTEDKRVVDPDAKDPNYGGSKYSPNTSKAGHKALEGDNVVLKSYGSMTYALLRAYLHTGLDKNDERVKLAYAWIARNFSVEKNPGFSSEEDADQQGLFYHYMQMARTLTHYGDSISDPASGLSIKWKAQLVGALKERQSNDHSWTNPRDRWLEGVPTLVTAYVMNTLAELD